jgi:hypothetical protein
MGDQYRTARGIVEELSVEQIADLYVRLEAAIDGDFYGGIAARNSGGASVVLEQRIAVGDPECRVIGRAAADRLRRVMGRAIRPNARRRPGSPCEDALGS